MDRRKFLLSSATAIGAGMIGAVKMASAKENPNGNSSLPNLSELETQVCTLPHKMRLCDDTIRLATKAVKGEWGREMTSLPFKLEDRVDVTNMSEYMKYA